MTDAAAIINRELGKLLLRTANAIKAEMKRRLDVSAGPVRGGRYMNPSRPGEFLHKRTGRLQAGLVVVPDTPEAAAAAGAVQIKYAPGVRYGLFWERRRDNQRRKGLIDLVREMAPELRALRAS